MPIIYQHRIHTLDLMLNPDILYAFGDNDVRDGLGGQAKECRGHENAVGIRTKRAPGYGEHVYWTDLDYEANCRKIDEDFDPLFRQITKRGIVVWPTDGVGTGLAELDVRAPKTLAYINAKFEKLVQLENACREIDQATFTA